MAHDRPFRLRALDALTACLRGVSVANGYKFDLVDCVFRGRLIYGDSDPIPLVSIVEAPLPDEPSSTPAGGPQWKGPWELYIQGWIDDDKENPTDPAHMLLADVKKALAEERKRTLRQNNVLGMGGKVLDIKIGGNVVRPAEEHVSSYANFMLAITLEIVENMDDPYA